MARTLLKMKPWTIKHKPKSVNEVIGNEQSRLELETKILNYKKGNKPIILYGGYGNGKTVTVQTIAEKNGLELIELNASDYRKADVIEEFLKGVLNQTSLFQKSKLVLIDELEGISGTKDRGALTTIQKLAEKSVYPIILIANDAYNDKLKGIRKKSDVIEYKPLTTEETYLILKNILEKENIEYEEQALKQIARMNAGDARAAINDIQKISSKITVQTIAEITNRDSKKPIDQALKLIFKSKNPEVVLNAFDEVEEDLDKIFLWVEENMPLEYEEPRGLAKGFENLAEADKNYGRIRRRQYYRLYVYCYNLLTAGIALSKKERNNNLITYKRNNRPLKMWIIKNTNAKKRDISKKLAEKTHTSEKEAFENIPYIANLVKNGSTEIIQELDLNQEEINWLKK